MLTHTWRIDEASLFPSNSFLESLASVTQGNPATSPPLKGVSRQNFLQKALSLKLPLLCAGTVPFKSNSIMGLYMEICSAELQFPPSVFVSESLKHLLRGMLDKNPETRMSLDAAMSHPWVTYNGELSLLQQVQ